MCAGPYFVRRHPQSKRVNIASTNLPERQISARPRVRGLEGRFESRILPLFQGRSEAVGKMLPELYLHGLALGDFELALRGLLGAGAPLSASSIARLKAVWETEHAECRVLLREQLQREEQRSDG